MDLAGQYSATKKTSESGLHLVGQAYPVLLVPRKWIEQLEMMQEERLELLGEMEGYC